jgi:hypothetical protein
MLKVESPLNVAPELKCCKLDSKCRNNAKCRYNPNGKHRTFTQTVLTDRETHLMNTIRNCKIDNIGQLYVFKHSTMQSLS